ncbi:MAG: winged helix-turn-helix transcriptional regulator [Parafilimonas sp.]|nr:winged helix-turn-helix transcriptional regulator [Parafilimonas sp.]
MNFYQDLGFLVFGSRLKRLGDTFINDVNRIYKDHEIDFDASWFPVFYILSQKKEISIKEISNDLKVSHSAISQLISSLQQKGFIKSVISKKDARHKAITFTVKGEKLLQKILPVWNALEKAMSELVEESVNSKKILKALTTIETGLHDKNLFERIDAHL